MKISDQMQCILLALLKGEKNPTSFIGQVMSRNNYAFGRPGLGTMDLMKFLRGPLAYTSDGDYRNTMRRSFWRSLKTLVKYGLVYEAMEKSPGKHGYLYMLTKKGRKKSEETWAEVSMFIDEYSKLL